MGLVQVQIGYIGGCRVYRVYAGHIGFRAWGLGVENLTSFGVFLGRGGGGGAWGLGPRFWGWDLVLVVGFRALL